MISIGLITFLIAVPLYSSHITHTQFSRITSFLLIYSCILSFNGYYIEYIPEGTNIYNGLFHISTVSVGIEIFLFVMGTMLLFSWGPLWNKVSKTEYSLIVIFTIIGGSLLISANDIVSMFLCIELQSFAVYVLATLYRNSESSTAAGLKYFLLGGLSSAIILLGTSLIYYNTGLTNLESIYTLISVDTVNQPILFFGAVLITIGFLFKVASAPFHNWAPDVYDGTPTIVTAWISTMPKISIFVFMLSFSQVWTYFSTGNSTLHGTVMFSGDHIGRNVILVASLLSLLLGTILGLSQYKIKRLLTYSTISHVGFLLLALVINSEESIESFIFYLIQYSITNVNVFIILLGIGYLGVPGNRDVSLITELKGIFAKNPLLSLGLAICLFSMAGIPPLVGFFAKQMVLYSSMHEGFYFISIVAIVVSVISASYYLKIVQVMYFSSDNTSAYNFEGISTPHSTIISVLTITITLFMFMPQISSTLLNSCHLLALSIFYY